MSSWIMYWILRAVDSIFLLLFTLFLTWYLYLYTRNSARRQDESESENQTVDTETDNINVNSSRDEGSDVINENDSWHQDVLLMIQPLRDELNREMVTLKDRWLKDIDQRVMKLEAASNRGKQIECPASDKIPEKQCGKMLEKDFNNIRTNFMFLIDNIQDPTHLWQSLFSRGVFNGDDVGKIRRCLQNESPRDATEKLLFFLLYSGENAYQPFLECLAEVGYRKVIEKLQQTQGESNNPQSEQVRLIEERESLMEWVNEKAKRLGEVVKEKEHDLQMLQGKNESINKELDELRNKMAKMEDEKQIEKNEQLQEISRLRAREDELLKNHEEIRENQRRILNQIQNLESREEDLKAATISREKELPKLQSDVTNLFTLLQKTATTEDDVCYHGNGQQQIHPVISTVPDLGSTDEVILGCNVDEEQDTIAKTKTNFLTLNDACLKGDLNNLKDLIESGHDINKKGILGMTPILYCSGSHIEPVPKIKMILGKSGNIDDRNKDNDNVLHQACTFGSLETVQFLLTQGVDVHSRGFNGRTPILLCCQSEFEPVPKIKLILDKGGNIEDIDKGNDNVLHLACRFGSLETVQFLVTQGLDVHSSGFKGRTPILLCCSSEIEPVPKIKLILDNGGNIEDIDKDNNNVLHLACKFGCLDTVQYLIELGLDVKSKNISNRTPVDCCKFPSVPESYEKIKLLEEKLKL